MVAHLNFGTAEEAAEAAEAAEMMIKRRSKKRNNETTPYRASSPILPTFITFPSFLPTIRPFITFH